jgi:hypothetical protein
MSNFKKKPTKIKYLTSVQTVDEMHRHKIQEFEEKKKSVPEKKAILETKIKELNDLQNLKIFKQENIKKKSKLKTEIEMLREEIKENESNNGIKEYYAKTEKVLLDYYTITNGVYYNIENKKEEIDLPNKKIKHEDTKNVEISDSLIKLNLLSQSSRKVKKPVKKRNIIYTEQKKSSSILSFLNKNNIDNTNITNKNNDNSNNNININNNNNNENKKDEIINRATLQDKFFMLVDDLYICTHIKTNPIVKCLNCNIDKYLNNAEGSYICVKCGDTEATTIIENENSKEMQNDKPKYPYKKINHLKEKLNQLQSRETAEISDDIYNFILNELKKTKIRRDKCTPPDIRKILKKYKLTECYEHLQQIYCKISGSPPIILTRETEELIIFLFNKIQKPYQKHRPKNKSNFLNYSYVLHKLFIKIGKPEYCKYFKLLTNKDKLMEQDKIWAKICADENWEYVSSFKPLKLSNNFY